MLGFLNSIAIVPAILCTFLAIVFWIRAEKDLKSLFLFNTFLLVAIASWIRYLAINYPLMVVWFIPALLPTLIVVGPTVFAYIKLSTLNKKPDRLFVIITLFAIPTLVFLGCIIAYSIFPKLTEQQTYLNPVNQTKQFLMLLSFISVIYELFFIGIAFKDSVSYYKNIKKEVYKERYTEAFWLILFTGGHLAVMLTFMFSLVLARFSTIVYLFGGPELLVGIFHFLVLIYYIIKWPEIISIEKPGEKYSKQILNEKIRKAYTKQIVEFFEKQKPYLEEQLTVKKLAEQVGIAPHHLSMVINQNWKMNFYQFINHFRIAEAKRLLETQPIDMTVLRICYMSGFQSKATFNHIFKQSSGQTPTQYRQSCISKKVV